MVGGEGIGICIPEATVFLRKGKKIMTITISGRTLYTVFELSQKLNVTTVTIRNYLKQGKLRGQKAMGRWFIAEEDVTDFFNRLQ